MLCDEGFVALIADAYIDDSGTHAGSPILCAGGFVFSPGNADRFNVEMGRVFKRYKVDYIRMADLNRRWSESDAGPYRHLRDDDREKLARAFIRTVKRRSASGFAATINETDYNRLIRPHPDIGGAIGFLLLQCVFLINEWANRSDFRGRIAYFIEHGTRDRGDAETFLKRRAFTNPEHVEKYRFAGLGYVRKDDAPIVSTGDLMAWHWYKYHANRIAGRTAVRGDTRELMRPTDNVSDWAGIHIDGLRKLLLEKHPDPGYALHSR
jgi:hypothetical protein